MWYVAYITYVSQLFSAQSVERTFTPTNIFISVIMYFTYAQLFTYLFIRSLILYLRAKSKKQVIGWDKTVRFKKINNNNKHRAPYALCLFIAV